MSKYPYNCESTECIRGQKFNREHMLPILIAIGSVGAVILIVSMGLIIFGSWSKNAYFNPPATIPRNERMFSSPSYNRRRQGNMEWKSMRKTLVLHATLYFGAFFVTWIFTIFKQATPSVTVDFLYTFFFPLQGFFNAMIFISHKVHNIKRMKPTIKIRQVLNILFLCPYEIKEIQITGMGIVGTRAGNGEEGDDCSEERLGSESHLRIDISSSHEDASREVRVSDPSITDEVLHLFDLEFNCSSNYKTNYSEEDQKEEKGSRGGLSMHDASTVKASSRWQSEYL